MTTIIMAAILMVFGLIESLVYTVHNRQEKQVIMVRNTTFSVVNVKCDVTVLFSEMKDRSTTYLIFSLMHYIATKSRELYNTNNRLKLGGGFRRRVFKLVI